MSLTSLLNGRQSQHKEFQSILRNILPKRESFETISGKNVFSKKSYETLVSYYLEKKDNASVIGIAFDYLARVMISRVVKQNHQEVYINTKAEFSLYVLEGILRHRLSQLRKIKRKLKKCLRKIRSFTRNKRDVKQLILEVCFLAKLERIYRSGLPPRDIFDRSFFYKPDDEVIRDLELLCNVFSERFIPLVNPASKVAYNPHFGAASAFVGGADADIIIDGTLYDFKTSKAIGYKWQEIAQIIGYYLLNDISTDIDKRNSSILERDFYEDLHIKRIAFYRARYGEIEYINISTINQENIQRAKKKLCAYFLKHSSLNKYMIENRHLLEEIANN